MPNLAGMGPFDSEGLLNVIVETPKGSRNKLAYDPERDLFEHKSVLPSGSSFPFDFGFLPATKGEDGDALDVLILLDEATPVGCLVRCRLLGAIEADQKERDGRVERNDRFIAVASKSHLHGRVKNLADLPPELLDEIEHFFISYNTINGKEFQPRGRCTPAEAKKLIEKAAAI